MENAKFIAECDYKANLSQEVKGFARRCCCWPERSSDRDRTETEYLGILQPESEEILLPKLIALLFRV